jgi:hypothetical protein
MAEKIMFVFLAMDSDFRILQNFCITKEAFCRSDSAELILTAVGVVKIFQEFEALAQAGEDGELSVEGILTEEEVEDGHVVDPAGLPVRVGHGDLIQI